MHTYSRNSRRHLGLFSAALLQRHFRLSSAFFEKSRDPRAMEKREVTLAGESFLSHRRNVHDLYFYVINNRRLI